MAIVIEGFIADICWEYSQTKEPLKDLARNYATMTWKGKKELYDKLFKKKLAEYSGFDGISALITFRNNLAHGRTYSEFTKRELFGKVVSEIETENKAYQDLRDYLVGKGILESRTTSSNFEVPWKIEIANHFVGLSKWYMKNILRENESDNKLGIETEFKLACDFL